MPVTRTELPLYGKVQRVQIRTAEVKARFLKGRAVRAVWVRFEDKAGQLSATRLLLATETAMSAEEIVAGYAKRWSIEPMFNQLKNGWGIKEAWQQHKLTLLRWVHLRQAAFAVMQLLAFNAGQNDLQLASLTPWRSKDPMTAGRMRLALARIFGQFAVRSLWDVKSRKFGVVNPEDSLPRRQTSCKAA